MADCNLPIPVVSSACLAADMHNTFAKFRPSFPFISLDSGGFVVLRYNDVARLLKDPRLQATETAMPSQAGVSSGAIYDIFEHGMLTSNDDRHIQRRTAISRALAMETLGQFRRHMRQAAKDLLASNVHLGRLELVSDYAGKLPIAALASLLEVPDQDVQAFTADVYAMNSFFRPDQPADVLQTSELAASRLREYLDVHCKQVTAKRSTGFLSRFQHFAEIDGLTQMESLMQIIQLIIGGTESVRMSLVASVVQLLSHGNAWRKLCEDRELVANAVTESLRLEPGIAGVVRVSREDIDIGGCILPAGQLVVLSFISALRDDEVFDLPDEFDLSRPNLKSVQLAFGEGAHKCVADAIARVELEEGLSALVDHLPSLRLQTVPTFSGYMFVRNTSDCWVAWDR